MPSTIPSSRVPLTDDKDLMTREWYRFLSDLFTLASSGIQQPGTMVTTFSGRHLATLTVGSQKYVINWSSGRPSSVQYYNPLTILVDTYTPTFTGRLVTAWTRS